ncbi:MAG: hypothetical protein ACI85O_000231 [Saprospiraceae bacterium]|jgi:hypothetical protein
MKNYTRICLLLFVCLSIQVNAETTDIPSIQSCYICQAIPENLNTISDEHKMVKYLKLTGNRYTKGLEIIRLMYEKILSLDHHFSSLKTFGNIAEIANPVNYPEFTALQAKINRRLKKDNAIKLPSLLEQNSLLSGVYTIAASLVGEGNPKEKEAELEELACMLDFTVKVQSDVNLIYYETEYLKSGNADLKQGISELFSEYVKVLGYRVPLVDCRQSDDWVTIYRMVDTRINHMQNVFRNGDEVNYNRVYREQINMEFSVDLLVDFLKEYGLFVKQGRKFYEKFHVIIDTYKSNLQCLEKLPNSFTDLGKDIDLAIEKFNEAYQISEISGSKMKDMMFGYEEYSED